MLKRFEKILWTLARKTHSIHLAFVPVGKARCGARVDATTKPQTNMAEGPHSIPPPSPKPSQSSPPTLPILASNPSNPSLQPAQSPPQPSPLYGIRAWRRCRASAPKNRPATSGGGGSLRNIGGACPLLGLSGKEANQQKSAWDSEYPLGETAQMISGEPKKNYLSLSLSVSRLDSFVPSKQGD